jgi:hypothetical protein
MMILLIKSLVAYV